MLISLIIIAGVYVAGLLALAGAVRRAPEGFEDNDGFHEGRGAAEDGVR